MLDEVAEFAVTGDLGTDVFRRVDDTNQRRYRYECIATAQNSNDTIVAHHDHARKHPARIKAALDRFARTPALHCQIMLGDPATYPTAADLIRPLDLFIYLDFFRMWQIAGQEINRMTDQLRSGAPITPPEISAVLRMVLDLNQIRRAQPLIAAFMPALRQSAETGKDDKWQNAGFSLRMVGDLHLRAGQPADALEAYELAIRLGDNPHRRGLAIQAAHAAKRPGETNVHLAAYQTRWPLTVPLIEIRNAVAKRDTGA